MRAIGIIPARYASTRFPGKPLAIIYNRTLIEHVYRRAKKSDRFEEIYVATDDKRIFDAVEKFGGKPIMTSPDHESGSDRIAEVVEHLKRESAEIDLVVNIQGDEPLLEPKWLSTLVDAFIENPKIEVATCMRKITEPEDLVDQNVVKVVTDRNGRALYFSRIMIPYPRKKFDMTRLQELQEIFKFTVYYQHIGIYAYRPDFLQEMTSLPPSPLEMIEGLEQLRILENGRMIHVIEVDGRSVGIDVPEDIEKVLPFIRN